jgi:hypothetical protein
LTIFAGSSSDSNIYFADGTAGTAPNIGYIQYRHASDRFDFGTNDTTRMSIDSSGRLLVGTSTARAFNTHNGSFQIDGDNYSESTVAIIANSNNADGAYLTFAKQRSGAAGGNTVVQNNDIIGELRFNAGDGTDCDSLTGLITCRVDGTPGNNDMPGRLVFSTTADGAASPTERMRIRSTGVVGTQRGLVIGSLDGGSTNDALIISGSMITSGAGNATLKWNSSTGVVTYDTSSRLIKDKITNCPYGIETVKQLQPRKYFRKDDQREEIGFIADEVVQIMPEFVPVGPKSIITRNDQDTDEIPLGVNYDKLTAVLTNALQEAIAKIETLEARLTAAGI